MFISSDYGPVRRENIRIAVLFSQQLLSRGLNFVIIREQGPLAKSQGNVCQIHCLGKKAFPALEVARTKAECQ